MSFEICKQTFEGLDESSDPLVIDLASDLEDAKVKIQKLIESSEYKHSDYDGKNKLLWARNEDRFPLYHFFVR